MSKETLLMSPADSNIFSCFEGFFDVIPSEVISGMISYESTHADMQALKIEDTLFVNSKAKAVCKALSKRNIPYICCENVGLKYPENIALNAAVVGKNIICKAEFLHPKVKEFCDYKGYNVIDCNQGYAACSTLIIDSNSIITDDKSVYKSAVNSDINTLLISKENIFLYENLQGFIGGCSKRIGDTVYFFGDVTRHKDYRAIKNFIESKNLSIEYIADTPLTDIGGIVVI